jgi:acetoin utilization protein AcuB
MFVKDRMTPNPIFGSPDMAVTEAQELMAKHKIRHLPILDGDKNLVGLITQSSLESALPSDISSFSRFEISYTLSQLKVHSIMITDIYIIDPDTPIEDAAMLMADKKLGALPVVKDGSLVGIMSGEDLFIAMTDLLGTRKSGIRVTVEQPDQSGAIARLTTAIAQEGGYLSVCVGYYPRNNPGSWISVCKVENLEEEKLVEVICGLKNTTIVDIRQYQEYE